MRYAVVFPILFVAACTIPKEAFISDINDSAVKVQAPTTVAQASFDAKAREGCAMYDKKPSEPLSERLIEGDYYYSREVLYACR